VAVCVAFQELRCERSPGSVQFRFRSPSRNFRWTVFLWKELDCLSSRCGFGLPFAIGFPIAAFDYWARSAAFFRQQEGDRKLYAVLRFDRSNKTACGRFLRQNRSGFQFRRSAGLRFPLHVTAFDDVLRSHPGRIEDTVLKNSCGQKRCGFESHGFRSFDWYMRTFSAREVFLKAF